MKKRKRIVSLMIMSLITTSSVMNVSNYSLAEKNEDNKSVSAYIKGYPDGSFGPDQSITRAESAKVVVSSTKNDFNESKDYTNSFADVKSGWYKNIVGYAQDKNIIDGYKDRSFGPDRNITRAEFIKIVALLNGFEDNKDTKFNDIKDHWARKYIAFAESKGWVDGYGNNEFHPESDITRAEVTKIINTITGRSVDLNVFEDSEDELVTFEDLENNHWAYKHIISAANNMEPLKTNVSKDIKVEKEDKKINSVLSDPATPEKPSAPSNPEKPKKPNAPSNTETPEVPNAPSNSETPEEPENSDKIWNETDFIIEYEKGYEGLTINGLSEKGKEKFKKNKNIDFPGKFNGEKIAAIGTAAFENMGIESVNIPAEINTIGLEAFRGNKIKKLVLPEGVEFIAMSAFENNEIESIELPSSLTVIRNKAFMNNKLTELVLPDNILKLHAYSFAGNIIKEVKLPEKVQEIEGNTFDTNIIERVNVPDSLVKLAPDSFYNNPGIIRMGEPSSRVAVYTVGGKNINNLKESVYILIDPEEDQNVKPIDPETEIGNGWQYDDFVYNSIYDVITVTGFSEKGAKKADTVKDLVLPDKDPKTGRSVTDIGEWAFRGLGIKSVELPPRLKMIKVGAFEDNKISYLEFGNELMEIHGEAFKNNNLTKINVPSSTYMIDGSTFEGNPGAYKDRVAVFTANGMNNGMSDSLYQLINPKGLVDKDAIILEPLKLSINEAKSMNLEEYEAEGIEEFKRVLEESENLLNSEGLNQTDVNLKAKELNKAMEKLVKKPIEEDIETEDPMYERWSIDNFEIEETTDYYTGIKKISIKGLTEKGLQKLESDKVIILPEKDSNGNTINSVSRYAFFKKAIDKVVIPGNYKYIQARSFEQTGLKELILSNGLEEIDSGAFSENNLTEVTIPKTVKNDGLTHDAFDESVNIIDLRSK